MSSSQPPKPVKVCKALTTSTTGVSKTAVAPPQTAVVSSHLAMIELKQRILASISKLSDRDTQQIATQDLSSITTGLSPEGVSMLLNCLCDASNDPKPAVKKEALRLLALLCTSHATSTSAHLTKMIAHIAKRLKDSDSGVRDCCRDAIGALASQYLKEDTDNGSIGSVVSLFVKPLFEIMGEQSKLVQGGASICMAKMVECAADPPISAFQKLCPRICKYLNSQSFQAKAALLPVVSNLSQVGAIAPQSIPTLLQSIYDCLHSSDWATRKAAAETLTALASHSSHLITDATSSTIAALEACRFDKIKPVRDSMTEALQLWRKIASEGGNGAPNNQNAISSDKNSQEAESTDNSDLKRNDPRAISVESTKGESDTSGIAPNFPSKTNGGSVSDRTVGMLKKKVPAALTDKGLNPDFFQKLETRDSDDLPVEVVVPQKFINSSNSQSDEESKLNEAAEESNKQDSEDTAEGKWTEKGMLRLKDSSSSRGFNVNDGTDFNQKDLSSARVGFSKSNGHVEGSFTKGNWLAIQRQLSQLERQQAHLMNMLQDFMGGSHDSMITLENRVRGLERVVEDMVRDLATGSGRRSSSLIAGFEGSSARTLGKYNGFQEYSAINSGRGGDGWGSFSERYLSSDSIFSGARARDLPWRSNVSQPSDSYTYGSSRNGHAGSRRALGGGSSDIRPSRLENDCIQTGGRRAWDKGGGPIRLGEGPSARSVWQASKDEATLEAIRVAGEDNETSQSTAKVDIPESNSEALGNDSGEQHQELIWTSWNNAMEALHAGDTDSAYGEVLSTGDDLLLMKLMDRSGPVMDQLSNEIAIEVLIAVGQFLLEQNLFDIGLSWIHQLIDIVMENGPDVFGIPMESKRDVLLNLHEASSVIDLPEDWEASTPHQLMMQLASAWRIDFQQFEK